MTQFIQIIHDFWTNLVLGQVQALGYYNYLLLALLVLLEGPIATLLGAVVASTGLLKPELVFLSAALGNLTADSLWYALGYAGKTNWILRYGRWLSIKPGHVQRLEADMRTHAVKILIVAKLTFSFSIPALVAAGMARVPWRRGIFAVAAAEVVWTGTLVMIGYNFSLSAKRLEQGLQLIALSGGLIFLFLIINYLKTHYGSSNSFSLERDESNVSSGDEAHVVVASERE